MFRKPEINEALLRYYFDGIKATNPDRTDLGAKHARWNKIKLELMDLDDMSFFAIADLIDALIITERNKHQKAQQQAEQQKEQRKGLREVTTEAIRHRVAAV